MGLRWTRTEDDLLRVAASYEHYVELAGVDARTRTAALNRRQRLKAVGQPVPEWEGGAPSLYAVEPPPELLDDEPEPFGFRERLEDEDTRDYWEAQKRAIAAHQRQLEKRSNRVIPYETDDPGQPFGIFFFGDTHLGSNGILADRMEHEFDL